MVSRSIFTLLLLGILLHNFNVNQSVRVSTMKVTWISLDFDVTKGVENFYFRAMKPSTRSILSCRQRWKLNLLSNLQYLDTRNLIFRALGISPLVSSAVSPYTPFLHV